MITEQIEVGQLLVGTVTKITNFGAFILLTNGKTGLVHISEVSDVYVREVSDFLNERETVTVKVMSLDGTEKIALSIKQANPDFRPASVARSFREKRGGGSFEEKLSKFMKDSEDRISDLRRVDGTRGGRGGRSN